jgi:hypothetical protein
VTAFTGNPTDREDLVIVVDVSGGVLRHFLNREMQRERRHVGTVRHVTTSITFTGPITTSFVWKACCPGFASLRAVVSSAEA